MTDCIKVNYQAEVNLELLADVVGTAFGGGIAYWCAWARDEKYPEGKTSDDFPLTSRLAATRGGSVILGVHDEWEPSEEGPSTCENPNCWDPSCREIKPVHSPDDGKYRLGFEELTKGLQLMAANDTERFAQMLEEDYDAEIADILVQYACFGKVIYG